MKRAKEDIIEITFKGSQYAVSILEKQNDSGLMFNDRLFFHLSEKCIGYLSQVKIDDPPERIDFEKAKMVVPIPHIKNVVNLGREVHIKLLQAEGSKKMEKEWILRTSTEDLAKKWYDRLHQDKMKEITRKSTPKNQRAPAIQQELKTRIKPSPPKKILQITRSQSFSYYVKPETERVETGVGVTPANSQFNFKLHPVQTKEVGTIISQKQPSVTQQNPKQQEKLQSSHRSVEKKLPQEPSNKSPQRQTLMNKASKQPFNEGKSDRSFAQQQKMKSVRSQPVSRKVEQFKPSRNEYRTDHRVVQQIPTKKQEEERSHRSSQPGKSNAKSKITQILEKQEEKRLDGSGIKSIKSVKKEEAQIKQPQTQTSNQDLTLSNKRYISQEQFEKLNTSTPISYLDRTSKLIKSSSNKLQQENPKINSIPLSIDRQQNDKSKESNKHDKSRESIKNEHMSKTVPETKQPRTPEAKRSPSASNFKLPIMEVNEEEDEQNESEELHNVIKDEFSSIKRVAASIDNEQAFISEMPLPWTYRYLESGEYIFEEFQSFSKDLLQAIIQDMRLPSQKRTFKQKHIKGGLNYYQIDDVQVKLALISIEYSPNESQRQMKEKVCSKDSIKLLQNQFNNFRLLYQHLDSKGKLKVPLICLCQINGFMALVKTLSVKLQKQIRMRDIDDTIAELQNKTKINQNFYHNHNKNILQLDQKYYKNVSKSSLAPLSNTPTNFNCFFIQEIEEYLLTDCVTDQQHPHITLLRPELIVKYNESNINQQNKPIQKLYDRAGNDADKVSKNILKVISEMIVEVDALGVYFLSSQEVSDYFHAKGINMRYLGHLYQHLTTAFQKRIFMSEIAARSCKALFRKTLQDIVLEEESVSPQAIILKACDFLNCITGNTLETAALWKVLSAHAQRYFGVQLNFQQIEKGYFLLSLVQNCRLRVAWEKLHPQEVFKEGFLFTEKNLAGVESLLRTYSPFHNQIYLKCQQILEQSHSEQGASDLLECLQQAESYPFLLSPLSGKIKAYLSLFISPSRAGKQFPLLSLYSNSEKQEPSRVYFQLLLMEIKWHLKLKEKDNYIRKCDQFIRVASKYFGEFHPIFSELYDVFSAYHQAALEFEDAITFAKSSLVNMLRVCGTGHERTSQCYYNLAVCYIKAGRKEEAMAHIRKAKSIFQNNGRADSLPYALISLKLALLHLNQDQTEDCLRAALTALEILERQQQLSNYQEEIVDCYETVTRCYEILQEKGKIREIAERCEVQLREITSPHNLERMLKITVYPLLSELSPENASLYLDILNQLSTPCDPQAYNTAFEGLRVRIAEESFLNSFTDYTNNLPEIERYLRQGSILGQWQSFKEDFPRGTINDFVAMTEQLIAFLGEGFVSGSLREAL